jgi:hypothetical protein
MRRFYFVLVAVVLALAATGVAIAAFAGGSVAGAGFVRATFEGQTVEFRIVVGAHGDSADAHGRLVMLSEGTVYTASVDCVIVVDNAALVVGTLDEPVNGFTTLQVEIVDNGNGHDDPPDAAVGGLAAPGPFDRCNPAAIDFSDAFPIESGNFVVRSDDS